MESNRPVYREVLIVSIGEVIFSAAMLGVFALLKQCSLSAILGAVMGCFLAILNFFFMSVGVTLAAKKAQNQDVSGAQGTIRISMLLRFLVLAVVLFASAESGFFHPISLVLPLVFVRPVLSLGEFFRK